MDTIQNDPTLDLDALGISRITLIEINPLFDVAERYSAAAFVQVLVEACRECTMTISLAELRALFAKCPDATHVVRVQINGQRIAEVKVVP